MKKIVVFLSFLCLIILCSCQAKLPEGDIKDFVTLLTYDKAFEETLKGKSHLITSHYIDGTLDGSIEYTMFFDKSDKYFYDKRIVSGSYYGTYEDQFDYYTKESISSFRDGEYTYLENVDGNKEERSSNEEEANLRIQEFFFKDFSASYHSGGMYYGDYILLNVAKYYKCFCLNEDGSELSFSVNTSAKNDEGAEIITMHSFTVNANGMLLSLETKSFYAKNINTYMLTKIDCQYDNITFDKIWNI